MKQSGKHTAIALLFMCYFDTTFLYLVHWFPNGDGKVTVSPDGKGGITANQLLIVK